MFSFPGLPLPLCPFLPQTHPTSPLPSPPPPALISPAPRIRRSFADRFACTRHFSSGRESKCGGTLGRRRPDVGWAHSPSGAEGPWGSGRLWPQTASASRPAGGRGWGGSRVPNWRAEEASPRCESRGRVGVRAALPPARASGNPKGAPLTPPPRCLLPGPIPRGGVFTPADAGEPAAELGPTSQAGLGCWRSPPRVARGAWVQGGPGEVRGMGPPPPKSPSGHTHQQELG